MSAIQYKSKNRKKSEEKLFSFQIKKISFAQFQNTSILRKFKENFFHSIIRYNFNKFFRLIFSKLDVFIKFQFYKTVECNV